MTPPPGPARALLSGAVLALAFVAVLAYTPTAAAQNGTANATVDFTFSILAVPQKAEWVVNSLQVPEGSKVVLVYNSTKAGLPHDIQVCTAATSPADCAQGGAGVIAATAQKSILTDQPPAPTTPFVVPKEGLKYVCSVHPEMVGTIKAGAFLGTGGGAGTESIAKVGVHWLAYWIGVISFAVLFVVYGASFFLFKHGETPETTDHTDRPDYGEKRTIMGISEYVWVIIGLGVVALGVVIFFQIMLSGL